MTNLQAVRLLNVLKANKITVAQYAALTQKSGAEIDVALAAVGRN